MEKKCKNCKTNFEATPDLISFCEQMKVNVPDICPQCGLRLVMSWRNENVLYKSSCPLCKKSTLSMYSPDSKYMAYCHDCWWGDTWDGAQYAFGYDSGEPLLDQFKKLQYKVPREALIIVNSTNSNYANHTRDSKDCYSVSRVSYSENVLYSEWIDHVKDGIDCSKTNDCENVLHCLNIFNCSRCINLGDSNDCVDCYFSYDLHGCNDCLFCWNLWNKSYHIFNKPVSKEQFKIERNKILDGGWKNYQKTVDQSKNIYNEAIHRFASSWKTANFTGNYLESCDRVWWAFDLFDVQDAFALASALHTKNDMCSYGIGTQPTENIFGCCVIKGGTNLKFSFNCLTSSDMIYCDSCVSCANCIACVGLRNKEYCILNKQYSKSDYEKIKNELENKGELAKMPGPDFSTFAYNESAACVQYVLSKEEVVALGYNWQDNFPITKGQETIQPDELPDNIKDTPDSIADEILKCTACSRNYRVIEREMSFYRRFGLPLPRQCPQCRMAYRRSQRLPYRLWKHNCNMCNAEIQTSYAPNRKEIIYCEKCYQSEVL